MTPQQAADFYEEGFQFLQPRKRRQVSQLVLLNNLRRGDQNIASTLLLTLFNRVLSSLYDDKMQVKFIPSQGITQEQIDAYNTLAQSDYLEMGKSQLDYDWTWDTLFFGRGYLETVRFDKKRKILQPSVINPLVFGYDPYFEDPQQWRYYWKWITKDKWEIKRLIKNGTITGITKPEDIPSGVESFLWNYKIRRDQAKEAVEPASDTTNGDVYQILEIAGHDDDGKRCMYWFDRGFTKQLYKEELPIDGDQDVARWPIVVKESFREPHSTVNFSVADLLEDKHRAKSVLLNLAFIAAKDRANPMYLYNPDKVTDVTQFFNRQINQHIPVNDINDAVTPLNTDDPMSAGLLQFISLLTGEANDPMGTGLTAQPVKDQGSDTATEAAITQQMNDMAQSLQSKIMQFGESEFWSHWFHQYARHAKALGSKMANIVGVKGVDSSEIDLTNFVTDYPPGVMVYSAKEAEYKNLVKRRDMMQMYPQLAATLGPDGMRNFNKHVFFPLMIEDPSLIDVMLPKTIDELKAEQENEQLKRDEMVHAAETDDHTTHIYTHSMVQPKTWATWIHLQEHEDMLAQQKAQQAQQAQMQQTGMPGQMDVGSEKQSPMAAAAPLKTEISPNNPTTTNG